MNRREETPIAQQPEKPPIRMEEIWEAEAEVKELQAAVVVRIQQLLDSLAGRKGAGDDQNKQIADAVCDIARKSGSELLCKGQVSAVRWYRGIFEARLTDWSKNTLEKKPEFPQLRARAKSRDREASRGV